MVENLSINQIRFSRYFRKLKDKTYESTIRSAVENTAGVNIKVSRDHKAFMGEKYLIDGTFKIIVSPKTKGLLNKIKLAFQNKPTLVGTLEELTTYKNELKETLSNMVNEARKLGDKISKSPL